MQVAGKVMRRFACATHLWTTCRASEDALYRRECLGQTIYAVESFDVFLVGPADGAVLDTLNLRLHRDHLAYVADHAEDKAIVVDQSLMSLLESSKDRVRLERVIAVSEQGATPNGGLPFEELLQRKGGRIRVSRPVQEERAT